jgi:uncharacterized protein YlzI (FlbEa/FlbD family)
MIVLHKLSLHPEAFHLNPDMITTIESHPDTVVTLATGHKVNVAESAEAVAGAIHEYRVGVLGDALDRGRVA